VRGASPGKGFSRRYMFCKTGPGGVRRGQISSFFLGFMCVVRAPIFNRPPLPVFTWRVGGRKGRLVPGKARIPRHFSKSFTPGFFKCWRPYTAAGASTGWHGEAARAGARTIAGKRVFLGSSSFGAGRGGRRAVPASRAGGNPLATAGKATFREAVNEGEGSSTARWDGTFGFFWEAAGY